MGLIAAEGVRALHRAPLTPAVADHDDQRRSFGPTGAAALALHRFVGGHLIGRMTQLKDALLFHPINEIRVVLGVTAKEILFDFADL